MIIKQMLQECRFSKKKTAEQLGVSVNTLWRKMQQFERTVWFDLSATNISRDSYVTRQAVPPGTVIFPDCGSDPQSGKITVQKVVKSRFDIEKAIQLSALLLSRLMLVADLS